MGKSGVRLSSWPSSIQSLVTGHGYAGGLCYHTNPKRLEYTNWVENMYECSEQSSEQSRRRVVSRVVSRACMHVCVYVCSVE